MTCANDSHAQTDFAGVTGPLVLVIMDGVGLYRGRAQGYDGNAFDLARTPNLDRLMAQAPVSCQLKAHGLAVGLPSDSDMGNSEVGHNAIGAGRIYEQGAKLVSTALADGSIFESDIWHRLVDRTRGNGGTFHLLGLLSDGNVHSHIFHLEALLRRLAQEGVGTVRVHPLADGRDVDPVTYHLYVDQLEGLLTELRATGMDGAIASGGGRMQITMDRYNANWDMVRRGWETHVLGKGRKFATAREAIATLRDEHPGIIDQDLPPFVIAGEDGTPVGPVTDGDAIVMFNFRGDRAIEISRAFTEPDLEEFDRGALPDVLYAGMMEYDGDLKIPRNYLVEPPAIENTLAENLVRCNVTQLAVAETQKFGHVTYFFNGNNSEKFDEQLETWIEVPSDNVPYETTPAMKAYEVCEQVVQRLAGGQDRFVRVNFANGDMVGHTGSLEAAIKAMETVDECIGTLEHAVAEAGGTMMITADHGNLDMMWEVDKKTQEIKRNPDGSPVIKTSHTLSPVPWLLLGKDADNLTLNSEVAAPGLGNIAATVMLLLGLEAPSQYLPSLVVPK